MDLNNFLSDTLHEISRGSKDRKHPFRYIIFSTMAESYPDTRMVVLRKFDRDQGMLEFYTDYRSNKVQQLKIDSNASILLWHPSKKIQVKLLVSVSFLDSEEREKKYIDLPEQGQHSYNTKLDPGTEVDTLPGAHQWREEYDAENFTVLQCWIDSMEVLKLNGKEHYRALFEYSNGELDKKTWLVP